jgi:hypothetical protein
MAKTINSNAVDASYDYIRVRATAITVCSAQPTTYTQANSSTGANYMLAKVAITSTGFTIAAGDAGGSSRKMTTQQKTGVSVTKTGAAKFIAWIGSTASILLAVTTCTSQTITTGNTLTIPAHKHEFGDIT